MVTSHIPALSLLHILSIILILNVPRNVGENSQIPAWTVHPYIYLPRALHIPQSPHTLSLLSPSFATQSTSFMISTFFFFPTSCCAGGEIWPPVSVAGSVLCCGCLPEICINKLPVPACPRCCPGAGTFAYRAVIGLPWVPSATAERVGGRQHHKFVLNWNLTAALHFMCVEARSKPENDQRERERKGRDKKEAEEEIGTGWMGDIRQRAQTTAAYIWPTPMFDL